MSFARAVVTVGGITAVSRICGFVRDMVIAGVLGAGPVADAFLVAFKLPNLFRRLFGEGAFNAAFVPPFSRLAADDLAAGVAYAERVISCAVAGLLALALLIEAGMPWAIGIMAPGFENDPARRALAIELARITLPYVVFVCLAAIQSGMLNARGKFAAAAATPILLNLILIGAVPVLGPLTGDAAHALAWGVTLAGAAQFVWLAVACQRAGLPVRLVQPRLSPEIRRLGRIMAPGLMGAGVLQLNLVIGVMLASTLPTGSVSFLYYADRVAQLPLGVVGAAVGTALLPLLVQTLARGERQAALAAQDRALEYGLGLTLPAAAALFVLAEPIMTVLFGRGAFSPQAVGASAAALQAYALGLPANVLVKLLVPGFFARDDTATPVRLAVVAMVANLVLALALMPWLAHVGIAAATSAGAWIGALLLGLTLHRRGDLALGRRLLQRLAALAFSTVTMAGALVLAAPFVARLGPLGGLAASTAMGLAIFGALGLLTGGLTLGKRGAIRRA